MDLLNIPIIDFKFTIKTRWKHLFKNKNQSKGEIKYKNKDFHANSTEKRIAFNVVIRIQ